MTKNSYSDAKITEIPASIINDKIQNGKLVEYDHIIIRGDIDVSKLELEEENGKFLVYSPIKITNSQIEGKIIFADTLFKRQINFKSTLFRGDATFREAIFRWRAIFRDTRFSMDVDFCGATFSGGANFREVTFSKNVDFWSAKFEGVYVTFKDAKFRKNGDVQEYVCRKAKKTLENIGDKDGSDDNFYLEMDGKRRQKPRYIRYPEFIFIQTIFGYGVHPFRLWACWFGFVFLFASVYLLGHGIDATASQLSGNATPVDYIWFSIATAVTTGYAGYKIASDFKLLAGLEAIFGTFMWAAFVATFTRKYMR